MPKPDVQFRDFVEVRTDADKGGFDGYASTFWTVDSYGTAFAPGAYKRTIGQRKRDDGTYKVPVLFQHNPGLNIGIPTVLKDEGKNGKGLYVESTLFDDGGTVPGTGSVTLSQLRQGAVYALSVGFRPIRDRSASDDDPLDFTYADQYIKKLPKTDIRVIEEVELWEFSVVTFEANQAAQIDKVRSDEELTALALALNELREGTISPEHLALIDELVVLRTAPGSSPQEETPTAPDRTSRDRDIALAITLANYREFLEQTG